MTGPREKPAIEIRFQNGIPIGIIDRTRRALVRGGADQEYINSYVQAAMSSNDYEGVIEVTKKYVNLV